MSNRNQRGKFDLQLRERERERRKELKLGNAWAIEFVGGEWRDYASLTMGSVIQLFCTIVGLLEEPSVDRLVQSLIPVY